MNAIGFLRPLRLANHAANEGYEVLVLMGSPHWARQYVATDPALAGRVDGRVKVVSIPTMHLFSRILQWRDALRKRKPAASGNGGDSAACGHAEASAVSLQKVGFKARLERVQQAFLVPDRYQSFILTGFMSYLQHCLFSKPDYLYVTGPPWSPVVLGFVLSKIFRIPLTIDYRDPWNHNPYSVPPAHPRIQKWLETAGLNQACNLVFSTEAMRKLYIEKHSGIESKCMTIYNGVDEETVEEIKALRQDSKRDENISNGRFVVIHVGRLYSQRMPLTLANDLAEVAARWGHARDILFRFVGEVECVEMLTEAFRSRGVEHKLHLVGSVSAKEAKRAQLGADCILLLQLGTGIQLPAKIFECVLMGKPIVCFADPESETSSLFHDYSLGTLLDESIASGSIETALLATLVESRNRGPETKAILLKFSGKRLATELLAKVRSGRADVQ